MKTGLFEVIRQNRSVILAITAGLGVVGGCVLSAKATLDAVEKTEQKKYDKKQLFMDNWKLFIPPAIVGISTIACVTTAGILNQKQQASIVAAYATIEQSYKKYIQASADVYGEEAPTNIRAKMAENGHASCNYNIIDNEVDISDEKAVLYYDSFTDMYIETPPTTFLNAVYHINRNAALRGYATLKELYDFLGIDTEHDYENFGWDMCAIVEESGWTWLDIGYKDVIINDDLECRVVDYIEQPTLLRI